MMFHCARDFGAEKATKRKTIKIESKISNKLNAALKQENLIKILIQKPFHNDSKVFAQRETHKK